MTEKPVLVIGATGYVGGRLVPRLLEAGARVRAMARTLDKLACRPWSFHPGLEMVQGDVLDLGSLRRAADGCGAAYYLVHSMRPDRADFAGTDRLAARNMARAAMDVGLSRIIYLGGLGEDQADLSHHLRSRHEVGQILAYGDTPLTHLRAAMILGSGSASFEILRYLCDRLPVMVTPRWVRTKCQPIAITNVLGYLVGCLTEARTIGRTFDIGGPEVLSYGDLFQAYAEVAGLGRRILIPAPFLSPALSAFWAQLVTPVPRSLIVPLIEGLKNEVVCHDDSIRELIPQELRTCRETFARALEKIRQNTVETSCSDAGSAAPPEWLACGDAPYAGGTIYECGYKAVIKATPEEVWAALSRIGGETGWYYGDMLWRLRGFLDKLVGGQGLRRATIRPETLRVGDPLDFWRVLEVEKRHRLVLLAEMKTPGEALLTFHVFQAKPGLTELTVHSKFLPRGLAGIAYWYVTYPLHQLVFSGMLRGLAHAAGKPLSKEPERFTPALPFLCRLK